MSSRPTIGLALIVKDVEGIIRDCLLSADVAGIFDQVVIVDTGSTDRTKDVIRSVAPSAQILDFTPETHPQSFLPDDAETWQRSDVRTFLNGPEMPGPFTGKMMLTDFGAARQFGWDALTTDYAMWIDSDDVVEGADKIRGVVESMAKDGVDMAVLGYDYSTDAAGRVTSTLTRERIALKRIGARWNLPIHEVLGPHAHAKFYPDVKISHRRAKLGLGYHVNLRNVKVLVHWWKSHDITKDDARMLFYMARDVRGIWPDKSLEWFREYCKRSGWDEERAQAHMYAGYIYLEKGDYEAARSEFAQASVESPRKPDAFFALARVGYHKKDWWKCIEWSEKGFKIEKEEVGAIAMLEYDPVSRAGDSYVYYAHALSWVNRHVDAIAACDVGLKTKPDDPHLKGIKEFCQNALAESAKPQIEAKKVYSIPNFLNAPLTDSPDIIPRPLLTGFAMHLWKMHMAAGRHQQAIAFLDALPVGLDDAKIAEARELSSSNVSLGGKAPSSVGVSTLPAYEQSMLSAGTRLSIAIWTGEAWESWTPSSLETGIGGSETAAVNMARELVRQGHKVTVISDCPREETEAGVKYVPWRDVIERRFVPTGDVAIVSRQPSAIDYMQGFKKRILWVHDVHVGEPNTTIRGFLERYDFIFALSAWHEQHLRATYPFLRSDQVYVTRNGIDRSRFVAEPVKVGNRLIYSSSWDRGLENLLELLPAIREEVPDVVLDVFYGSKLWRDLRRDESERIDVVEDLLRRMEAKGQVRNHGRVGQKQLAEAFLAAKVWLYPTWFHETSCISAMEAQAAGCVPVTTALAALPETVKHGVLVAPPCTDFKAKSEFIRNTVELLTNEEKRSKIAAAARAHALASLGWDGVVADWDRFFGLILESTRLPTRISTETRAISPAPAPAPAPAPVFDLGVQILPRRHRVAIIMGRLSSSVHGIYDVDTLYDEGMMTGTGSSFFNIAWGLAERGHVVDVFCQAQKRYVASPKLAGANVYNIDEPGLEIDPTYDAYISINEPDMLRVVPTNAPRICAMWLNDWSYTAQGFDDFVDMYACPSWTHARYIHETTRIAREKLTVINLASNAEFFMKAARRPRSVAWSSSPDRGLHHLLNFWPRVRARVPDAELRIYYRFKPWFDFMTTDPSQVGNHWNQRAVDIGALLDKLGKNGENGVYLVDSVPPKTMAEELCKTRVLAYPCDPTRFTEGFSCSIMDACAAGCVPIVSEVDALPEIYGGTVHMVANPPEKNADAWVDAIVRGLMDDDFANVIGGAARALAARHTRQVMAAEWEALIEKMRR